MAARTSTNARSAVVIPYANEHLNAALYAYDMEEPTAHLLATFSRRSAAPRGRVLVTFYNHGEEDDDDVKTARTRAWPFAHPSGFIEVATGGICC